MTSPFEFPIGSNIILQNLIAGAKYNGLRGIVKSNIDTTSLRQNVFIVDANNTISVKTANICIGNDNDNDVSSLSIKQLKSELHSYNISTESYFDKESLVDAVRKARGEGWRRPVTVSEGYVDGKKRAATTASTAEDRSKKKKAKDETAMNCGILDKLPDGLLEIVASYLFSSTEESWRWKTFHEQTELQKSCLSFAQAMTHSHQNIMSFQPSKTTLAILKQDRLWEMLDFKYVADFLGREITDADVRWLLQCIDAVNHVKMLKLTNCSGITGVGLFSSLRGSTVLEKIDLSLVDNQKVLRTIPQFASLLM